ncbi:winged helix-turn-helix domain-containing protein [Acetohalobium arabaticum]|uniref:Putative transcriptional regulator, ModE family n=1 Tax=Acetohalobium arabaticum (strain ATCC 49924 / DSM 5501 / Z-7288) TaxID=574087 RepID=D9QUW3_ACEAZ|nr:LysR family transcriptional regulator [Acetohalobium arabaticum]ADL12022.1 putative transcriptional regulator, ModE family [Acetohalobium arabaticum DSM 5501]
MEIKWKIWLEEDDGKVFGDGPRELLSKVKELGSLRQAAKAMDMSYSKAWSIISMIEKNLDVELLQRQIGGSNGGGSELTEEGKEILIKYHKMEQEVDHTLQKIFQNFFNCC